MKTVIKVLEVHPDRVEIAVIKYKFTFFKWGFYRQAYHRMILQSSKSPINVYYTLKDAVGKTFKQVD